MLKRKKGNGTGLEQILLNVVIIEAFSIVENWLLFYYKESQVLPIIFGVLTAMMCCLLTINIYNCFIGGLRKGGGSQDSLQAQAVLYKQMKKLQTEVPENVKKELDALEANVFKELGELKKNQLRSVKAVLSKVEELQTPAEDMKNIMQMLEQIQHLQSELKGMLGASPAAVSVMEQAAFAEAKRDIDGVDNVNGTEEAETVAGIEEAEAVEGVEAEAVADATEAEAVEGVEEAEAVADATEAEAVEGVEEAETVADATEAETVEGAEQVEAVEESEHISEAAETENVPEASDFLTDIMGDSMEEDDIPSADELINAVVDEESDSIEIENLISGDMSDPNKQLSADEIAALFSGVN